MKICPYCSEEIKATAVKCRYCNEWFDNRPSGPTSGSHPGYPPGTPSGSQPSTPSGHTPLTGIHLVNHALGDRYEILEEIGRGGMATVYKAIQKSLKRPVALKVVHQNLLHDTEFVARFHREAQLCASLNHPNIVHVYDEGEVSGVHFMAMEYLEGTDLHRLIRSRGRLTPEQTLQYLLPVAEALDYAHGKGYIHRDIKSANIFITGSGRVVLMDFGIAHAAAGTQLTRAGTVIGTPEYMSPEQAEGKKVDHRTDLYSLGVVMYECLAGRVPFSGENAMSTIFQLTRNEPDDKPLGQTPTSIRELVTALLRKKPENRPASARSVAEGMKLLQQGKQWQPSGVASKEASLGSKSTAEKTQEPQTVKFGEQPGRPTSQGSVSPPNEKKKIPAAIWFLALLGLMLVFVLVYQFNEQQRVKEQRELARIEERRVEDQRREEERKAQEADRQKRLAEEQRQREQEEAERRLAEQRWREQQEAEQRQQAQREAERQRQLAEERQREEAARFINYTENTQGLNLEMVAVKGGSFTMGCTSEQGDDCWNDEKPAHSVTLSDYYIGKYPVTQRQWRQVMGSNPSHFSDCDDCPVERVSWNDVQGFIRRLNQLTGKIYGLPTEAQWEYAARGGQSSGGFKYAGSNNIGDVAWYSGNSNGKTHPIGQLQANELGIYDMSGNVWEWCSDWFGSYSSDSKTNPTGPSSGSYRVLRGGSWRYTARYCRVSLRHSAAPDSRGSSVGFRLSRMP